MTQLVSPNLSAVGQIGWCLEYASRVWGTTYVPDPPFAWTAWQETKHRLDSIPTDIASICWFSFFVNGVNEGHVVASVPGKGFYSSPWQLGTTHAVLPSIAEVERLYGVKYVGCSADILNLIVIGESMTPQEVAEAYSNYAGQNVTAGSPPTLNRQPLEFFRGLALANYDTIKALEAQLVIAQAVPADVVPYAGPQLYEKKG